MSIERRDSRANISIHNNSSEELRRKTPSRHSSGLTPVNSSIEASTPNNRMPEGPYSLLLDLLRMIVRKLQDIEHSWSVELSRNKKSSNGLISINEKSIQMPPKHTDMVELPRMDLLLEKLQAASPVRAVKELKHGQSPAHIAYEELELKLMMGQRLKPTEEEIEKIKSRLNHIETEMKEHAENQEEELMSVIMALKDFAADRRFARKG